MLACCLPLRIGSNVEAFLTGPRAESKAGHTHIQLQRKGELPSVVCVVAAVVDVAVVNGIAVIAVVSAGRKGKGEA